MNLTKEDVNDIVTRMIREGRFSSLAQARALLDEIPPIPHRVERAMGVTHVVTDDGPTLVFTKAGYQGFEPLKRAAEKIAKEISI